MIPKPAPRRHKPDNADAWLPPGETYRKLCAGLDPDLAARFEAERRLRAHPTVEHLTPDEQLEREERERIYLETRSRERLAAEQPEQGDLFSVRDT